MSESFGLEQSDRLASLVMTETAAAASAAIVITSMSEKVVTSAHFYDQGKFIRLEYELC